MVVKNEKELGKAIKNGENTIEIEVEKLGKKVIRIKATGKVAWGVCAAALAVAIASAIATAGTAGASSIATVPTALIGTGTAAATLGADVAASAVLIGAAGGGIGTLNKLRNYDLEKVGNKKVILHKSK